MTADVLDASEYCLRSPEKRIGVGELRPNGFVLSISVWVNAHGFQDTKLELQEKLLQGIKDSGINIASL